MLKVVSFYNCVGNRTMRALLIGCSLAMALAPAQAAVSAFGSSLARDCFDNAQTGLKDAGLESCTKALQEEQLSDRDRAATLVNRGIIHNRSRQLDPAIADFGAALQINQDLGEAYLNRGNAHFFRREFDLAAADYTKAIELKSGDVQVAYYNRALVAEVTGKFDEAKADLQSALAIRADFKDATLQMAELEKRRAAAQSQPSPAAPGPQVPTGTAPQTPPAKTPAAPPAH
jgi:tetratricopeptide (TPR) repeat protein